ncbi:hypothetical protein PF005_g11752 [Phytophthora fragariae]|uniref:Uncharacterized protein n=1 Tax=Phytophthora fragariae TaxID=53985 RepID=A0A6A3KYA6_9STRA|nr:hypothetical protein PF011_g10611 [Phytophthora fragariae]KAE9144059.1 hypothetical protein PF006_g10953 [Phytophthora fragariae]KAE9209628.1 hypothetical protein PF005_g11752 [Phytophthora fragariae]KAE9229760.1 hypothetical protein PF002_g13216 [Phytophthora fragariae]
MASDGVDLPRSDQAGKPCLISWGLDADGLCKYHALSAGQCLGIARTSGQRCRVKWDLDAAGYCAHHRTQAPLAPASALPGACHGVTKRGSPCSVTWALDADGFCKFHAPNASQCKGLARASGRRCKIKWGLDARGYCQFHQRTVGIDVDGFCTAHGIVKTELPLCMGTRPGAAERCKNNAKTGYDFCCAAHDPKFAASVVAPSVFNDPGLRSSVEAEVVKKFKGRDLYHGDKLDLNTVGAVELDHIVEKQCFAYALQRVEFRDGEDEAQDVARMLREEVVNELPNLCLTRTTTNKMKGAAVSRFLDDSMTGHRGLKTFTDYMLAQKRDDTRLARDVTRTIRSEMGSALRRCQWKLADEGETPALDALSAELQQLYVDMDLHTSRSGKTKSRATGTVESKVPVEDQDDEYVLVDSATTDTWTMVDVKRSVTVEARQPMLSADAKPFVPGAVQSAGSVLQMDTNIASVAVDPINRETSDVESKVSSVKDEQDSPNTCTTEVNLNYVCYIFFSYAAARARAFDDTGFCSMSSRRTRSQHPRRLVVVYFASNSGH